MSKINDTARALLPLLTRYAGSERFYVKNPRETGVPQYIAYKGRLYGTHTRLVLSVPYEPVEEWQDGTLVTSTGRYPFPGAIVNGDPIAGRLDTFLAAGMCGHRDTCLTRAFRVMCRKRLPASVADNGCYLTYDDGRTGYIGGYTCKLVKDIADVLASRGESAALNAYTYTVMQRTVVSVQTGGVILTVMPQPIAPDGMSQDIIHLEAYQCTLI